MKKRNIIVLIVIMFVVFLSCNTGNETTSDEMTEKEYDSLIVHEPEPVIFYRANLNDSLAYLLADTISYGVVVRNPDSLDTWTEKCLNRLDLITMVDVLFEAVYDQRATAYDYYTNEPLSIKEVK